MVTIVPEQELAAVKTEEVEMAAPLVLQEQQQVEPFAEKIELRAEYIPTLVVESTTAVEETNILHEPVYQVEEQVFAGEEGPIVFELDLTIKELPVMAEPFVSPEMANLDKQKQEDVKPAVVAPAASNTMGSFLKRPTNIYANEPAVESNTPAQAPEAKLSEGYSASIELVEKLDIEAASEPEPLSTQNPQPSPEMKASEEPFEMVFHEESSPKAPVLDEHKLSSAFVQEIGSLDEAEVQKARAAERLHKLRNLSFNFGTADHNNEYENIPAYVRQNLQVHNTTMASVEKFYSSYAVGTDENNITQISTINTFLEGKKPD
jgi:cell division protein FtsZ